MEVCSIANTAIILSKSKLITFTKNFSTIYSLEDYSNEKYSSTKILNLKTNSKVSNSNALLIKGKLIIINLLKNINCNIK